MADLLHRLAEAPKDPYAIRRRPMSGSRGDAVLPATSRWVREGGIARRIPWRLRDALERWTIALAYPSTAGLLEVAVGQGAPRATLVFGGDVALHRWTPTMAAESVFGDVAPLLASCDARFVNLESQLTSRAVAAGTIGFSMRAEPSAVRVLRHLGITAVTCANNHCLDYGDAGLAESLEHLAAAGIGVAGVRAAPRGAETIVTANGARVGLLAYTDDWREPERRAEFPHPRAHVGSDVRRDIVALKPAVDLVAVQAHWGYEWVMYPMRTLRDLARSYVDAGADLVVCHHAHVPAGIEAWGTGVIAYGLGNCYFGRQHRAGHPFRDRSFLLRVAVSDHAVRSAEAIPIHTTPDGRVTLSRGRIADTTLRSIAYLSCRLNRDDYLDEVERSLVAGQGCGLVIDLARRLSEGDVAGARERVLWLRPPRQRWLIERLLEADGLLRDLGTFLADLLHRAGDRSPPSFSPVLASLARQAQRHLAVMLPKGRIP